MAQYDIFISYKRIGASKAVAYRIYSALKNKGYKVFYDREEMFAGKFNEQLYNNIDNAKDIIIILEQGSLKACYDKMNEGSYKSDYFCREIMHALKRQEKLRIIPILLDGYQMPTDLPQEFNGLSETQAIDYDSGGDFELVYEEYLLNRKFLSSTPIFKKNDGIADFLFCTNGNCDVWEYGSSIAKLTPDDNEDHPYRHSVMRSGEHRFSCVNYETGERKNIEEIIETGSQKYIFLDWKLSENIWVLTDDDINRQNDEVILLHWGKTLFEGIAPEKKSDYRTSLKCFQKLITLGNLEAKNFVLENYLNSYDQEITSDSYKWFQTAEQLGCANATTGIGYCHYYGHGGCEQSFEKAVKFFKKAASQKDASACRFLYNFYTDEIKDEAESENWLRKAAIYGDSWAQCVLGDHYYNRKLYEKAIGWYQKADNQDYDLASCCLGDCYFDGTGCEKDMRRAFEYYKKASNHDNARACYRIGAFYEDGEDGVVEKNYSLAFEYYEKSASNDDPFGQMGLGRLFRYGKGVERDYAKALQYYQLASDIAIYSNIELGWIYARGLGVKTDYYKAIEYFEKTSESEALKGEFYHGIGYCNYHLKRYQDSVKAYEKAIECGYENVYDELGRCYEIGTGVEKNTVKAVDLYEKGVELGQIEAQFYLASCYERGIGVTQNYEKAIELYNDVSENENTCEANIHLKQEAINAIERLKKM